MANTTAGHVQHRTHCSLVSKNTATKTLYATGEEESEVNEQAVGNKEEF